MDFKTNVKALMGGYQAKTFNEMLPNKKRNQKDIVKLISMPNLGETADGTLAFAHYCVTINELNF